MIGNYISTLKKFLGFSGRTKRKEYWAFIFSNIVIFFLMFFIMGLTDIYINENLLSLRDFLMGMYFFVMFLFSISSVVATARRLHDIGISSFLLLLGPILSFDKIPSFGVIILFNILYLPVSES